MEENFDLKQLFSVLRGHLFPIIISAFLCASVGFFAAETLIPKKYEASAMLYVENNQQKSDVLNINDITAAQKLVNTCQIIFQSNTMLKSVIFELDLPYTKEELSSMISVTSVNNTEVMRISASCEDAALAADIVNVMVELSRKEFVHIIKSGSIEVVEYAETPDKASFPSIPLFTAAGFMAGALLSYIIFFIKEILSVTVTPRDDLARIYDIPVFAEIMDFEIAGEGGKYASYSYGNENESEKGEKKTKAPRRASSSKKRYLLDKDTPFVISEAYRAARTNLIFSLAAAQRNIISFTSAEPGEGKSTTCANMAVAFADMGKRVLLIDCDMRKPTVQTAFKLTASNGLSSVLGGFCTLDEAIAKNVKSSLDVLAAGPIPPNPTELLGSGMMIKLLENVSSKYDYVLVDTPPINVVTDSQLMNGVIGGHVFVVRENMTSHPDIAEALEKADLASGKKLGFIKSFCTGGLKSSRSIGKYGKYGKYGRYGRKYGYYSSYGYEYKEKETTDSTNA